MNDLLHSLDGGKMSIITLLDLTSAFDTIDHFILLKKLERDFGIKRIVLSWFQLYVYLTERFQSVDGIGFPSGKLPLRFVS